MLHYEENIVVTTDGNPRGPRTTRGWAPAAALPLANRAA